MILIITEKQSVAKDIAKVLKVSKSAKGYFYNDTHVVTWAIGHLITLCEPQDYDKSLEKWAFAGLPISPKEMKLKPIPSTKSQLSIIKTLLKSEKITEIVCATDSGREGELIFRYIYHYLNCKLPFKRLFISSMTDTAILEGFANLKDGSFYDNLYKSAKCRSESDWLVGMNATRAYTLKYNTLLSVGRVQTPTLSLIVERQIEINNFNEKLYYEIKATMNSSMNFESQYIFNDEKNELKATKIESKEKAEEILSNLKNFKTAIVSNVEKELKTKSPELLYDLTALQREANEMYGYSADKTLSIAQSLYATRKVISYPRTDSRYLSDDLYPKLQTILNVLKNTTYDTYLEAVKLKKSKRIFDNSKITDHHAIIPTEQKMKLDSLSGDELNIYDLVVRRFLSVFYEPYKYEVTKIFMKIDSYDFMARGSVVKQLGYMQIYNDLKQQRAENKTKTKKTKNADDTEDKILPILKVGQTVDVLDYLLDEKKTAPKKNYTDATLLSAMQNAGNFVEDEAIQESLKDSGIGTPATRAAIIERLITVKYIYRKGKSILPTDKGMKLYEIIPIELRSPAITGKWERGLNKIAIGEMDDQKFMASINRFVEYLVHDARTSAQKTVFEDDRANSNTSNRKPSPNSLGKCSLCGGDVLENTKAYYCSNFRSGCKFTVWKSTKGIEIFINADIMKEMLSKEFHEVEHDNKTFKLQLKDGILKII